MDAFTVATLARRGLLAPGRPDRITAQLLALARWGFGLAGELRSAAERSPNRVAIIDESEQVTYRELVRRAERLATALRGSFGVRAGDPVALLCRNHAVLVEAMVATGMLGADVVLVNTGVSPAQFAALVTEHQVRTLLYDDEFIEHAAIAPPELRRIPTSTIDKIRSEAAPGPLGRPERDGRTIVLTSGTTGIPKGAPRPSPPGLKPLASLLSRIPLRAGERMLIAAPLFHTWGYAALQMAIALRGTVVLQRRFEPATAVEAIDRYRCGALFVVPVMLQRLLDVPHQPLPLRVVATSGSALPGDLAIRFMDRYGDVLYNLYGSTEASWASIATPRELRRDPRTAGRPPHGTRIAILDATGKPVPAGHVGRIFVGNDMLFSGYTNGDGKPVHDGMLATGDVGHLSSDGLLYVDGREDDMVISGGENVFPSEVEHVLARLPQVREVAVVGVPDAEFGQRLAAYIVLRPGEWLDGEAVREYVRRHLARFSVPRDVIFLDELPRNATGKVVPRHLPK
ncbi:MAG TPA: AMP-binding protein [Micromonosporaceae bacterium]